MFKYFWRCIMPFRCPCCGRMVPEEGPCSGCESMLPWVGEDCCPDCGYERFFCQCFINPMKTDGVTAPFYNEGRARRGVYRFKFKGLKRPAEFFGRIMAQRFLKVFPKAELDAVCFVPDDKETHRRRGYNHAQMLARAVARQLNLPCRPILKKLGQNLPQHTLKAKERRENVKGKYAVAEDVKGQNILVVDDIRTTGATLNECAKILKKAKAKRVYGLTAVMGRNLQ